VDDPGHRFGDAGAVGGFRKRRLAGSLRCQRYRANNLYRNKHDGTFEDIGLLSGSALTGEGRLHASMGVDVADFDHRRPV